MWETQVLVTNSLRRYLKHLTRFKEQQISSVQTNPENATIEENNMAIQAVKVPTESVVSRALVFEAILEIQNNTLETTVKTGERPKKEAVAAISFQLPIDILSDIDGMYALLRKKFCVLCM